MGDIETGLAPRPATPTGPAAPFTSYFQVRDFMIPSDPPQKPSSSSSSSTTTTTTSSASGGHSLDHGESQVERRRALLLLFCIVGTISLFLTYGVLQERIMTTAYHGSARFLDVTFVLLMNRVVGLVVSGLIIVAQGKMKVSAPWHLLLLVSAFNLIATFCQYETLKYVSFLTQTMGKCAKSIFVMLAGTLIGHRMYSRLDYLLAVLVVLGCGLFLMTGSEGEALNAGLPVVDPIGMFLILSNLVFDGIAASMQDKLFVGFSMTSFNQMFFVSAGSILLLTSHITMFGNIRETIAYIQESPACFYDILLLSCCSAAGQGFINFTIKEFGALVNSTVMTFRQFLSILSSALIFHHHVTLPQGVGIVMVFASSTLQLYRKGLKKSD